MILAETPRCQPGEGEIEIQVKAGGINFRDVMKALGMYPGNPVDLKWFGDDIAGTVVQVGPEVNDLKLGDKVVGMVPYGFRSFVTVNRNQVFKQPDHLDFEAAATLPTVFLTSYYALVHLARMQKGERILIHAGTGGVGSAAIQIAKSLELEIFATAGTPEKRQLLKDWGVQHVMNSRTLDFADEIRAITQGEGIDCVLNSLAGDFIPKSFGCLRRFGRFVEIGKIDVYNNTKFGLEMLKNNISYFVVDLAQLLESKPEYMAAILKELEEKFHAKTYRALPYKTFPITEVVEAFRYMAQGKHVGKNVLNFDLPDIQVAPCTQAGHLFRADGTYLITGGAGGFGFELAKWMAKNGARNLALMSRSGPGLDAQVDIQVLRSEGVNVIDARADVTEQAAVKAVIDQIQASDAKMIGVIHGAMVIDDREIINLDEADFNRVLHPKMLGAWILHNLTLDIPLDLFVSFSSVATVLGSPRQSNYNAGNAFLDAIAQHRHALGLPALTFNWGPLGGAGFVERNEKTAQYLDKLGMKIYTLDETFSIFQRFINRQAVNLVASRLDWHSLVRLSSLVANSKVYSLITQDNAQSKGGAIRAQILAAPADARHKLMLDFLTQQVAVVFNTDMAKIDQQTPLPQLGLDSLMAIELVNRVETQLGITVPMGSVLNGPNLCELAIPMLELLLDTAKENELGESDKDTESEETAKGHDKLDLQAEAILDDDIRPAVPSIEPVLNPKAVLLTGGTGFLGAFLIRDLLSETRADIYCLVRAEDLAEGQQRLQQNLSRYGLWKKHFATRIFPVLGNITKPDLGISESEYAQLAERIDVIYHSAAALNFVLPYNSMKPTNVDGTKEVLRFACWTKVKPVHHVSSLVVFESSDYTDQVVTEAYELNSPKDMTLGYSQSKWVAEKLVLSASDRGLPVTIHRPSFLLGDTKTGVTNIDDFVCIMIKSCLQLGACPDLDFMVDSSPVDYVSQSIVYLSQQPESIGQVFHLQHPNPIPLSTMLTDCVSLLGLKNFEQLPYKEWTEKLATHVQSSDDMMSRLLPVFTETNKKGLTFPELNVIGRRPDISCQWSLDFLSGSGIICPQLDDVLFLAKLVSYLSKSGFIDIGHPEKLIWPPYRAILEGATLLK